MEGDGKGPHAGVMNIECNAPGDARGSNRGPPGFTGCYIIGTGVDFMYCRLCSSALFCWIVCSVHMVVVVHAASYDPPHVVCV